VMWSVFDRNSRKSGPMANTSERMLRLLSLLQSHRDWSGADLAERLEVSPRTVRRDVDRLRLLGYPVDATPGVDGGYRLAAGAALPPLVLDDDEAVALVIALRGAASLAISGAAEASVSALAKVVQVLPSRLRQRAENLAEMTVTANWSDNLATVDPTTLATLATAARNVERVEFSYRDRAQSTEDRLVEPAQLVMLGRRWYLAAYDVNRHDWRTFRVDRVRAARNTGRHFNPKPVPSGDAVAYVRSSIRSAVSTATYVMEVAAPAEIVRERFGHWARVSAIDAGSCRMEVASEGAGWPTTMLVTLGVDFTVVSPPAFRRQLADAGERFRRCAGP
jgi:predicted DNA-binding transcriptional regulator YafY